MNNALKHVIAHNESQGYDTSNADILEALQCAKQVHYEIGSQHRWYYDTWNVVDLDGMLIGFSYFTATGDNSIRDMDLEFDVDSVVEVEAYSRMVTEYRVKSTSTHTDETRLPVDDEQPEPTHIDASEAP